MSEELKNISGYQLEDKEEILDLKTGEIVDQKELTPFEIIKATAKKVGQEVLNPKKDCKSCYGRGYIGFISGTHQPIPCNCIFTFEQKKNMQYNPVMNRASKRNPQTKKEMKKRVKMIRKLQAQGLIDSQGNFTSACFEPKPETSAIEQEVVSNG